MINWAKKWGTLTIAVCALGVSGFALIMDCVHFEDLQESQQARYDELNDQFEEGQALQKAINAQVSEAVYTTTLNDRLGAQISGLMEDADRIERDISDAQNKSEKEEFENQLREVRNLRMGASVAWSSGNLSEADILVSDAYKLAQELKNDLQESIIILEPDLEPYPEEEPEGEPALWVWAVIGGVLVSISLYALVFRKKIKAMPE